MVAKTSSGRKWRQRARAPSARQTAFWFVGCKLTPPLECVRACVTWRGESGSVLLTSIGPLAVDFCLGVKIRVLVCEVCSLPKNERRGKFGLCKAGKRVVVVPLIGKRPWASRFSSLNLVFPHFPHFSYEGWCLSALWNVGRGQGKVAAGAGRPHRGFKKSEVLPNFPETFCV